MFETRDHELYIGARARMLEKISLTVVNLLEGHLKESRLHVMNTEIIFPAHILIVDDEEEKLIG